MDEILSKQIEVVIGKQSKAIDDFIKSCIPAWKRRIMIWLPFTVSLFGYHFVQRDLKSMERENLGSFIEVFKRDKKIGTLKINIKIKYGKN